MSELNENEQSQLGHALNALNEIYEIAGDFVNPPKFRSISMTVARVYQLVQDLRELKVELAVERERKAPSESELREAVTKLRELEDRNKALNEAVELQKRTIAELQAKLGYNT